MIMLQHVRKIISIYTINILLSHIELYFTKQYIDDCTQPDEKFIALGIHIHPLLKRMVGRDWCSVCDNVIFKVAYRCAKCNFDCCEACWQKRDKATMAAKSQIDDNSENENKTSGVELPTIAQTD